MVTIELIGGPLDGNRKDFDELPNAVIVEHWGNEVYRYQLRVNEPKRRGTKHLEVYAFAFMGYQL